MGLFGHTKSNMPAPNRQHQVEFHAACVNTAKTNTEFIMNSEKFMMNARKFMMNSLWTMKIHFGCKMELETQFFAPAGSKIGISV